MAARAFADEAAQTFEARITSTEMQVQAHGGSIMIDRRSVHLKRAHVLAPILRTNVSDLCAWSGDEVVDAAGKSWRIAIARLEMLNHRHLRELIRDEQQMGKDRHVVVAQPVEDLDRLLDFEATRHEEKGAG